MDKVYYIIASGGNYKKPIIEKVVFPAKDKLTKQDIVDCINDICDGHSQNFAYAVALKEEEFLSIQAMNPKKIKVL
jgi:hypothetical protein